MLQTRFLARVGLLLLLGGKLNAILRRERERAAIAHEAVPQPA